MSRNRPAAAPCIGLMSVLCSSAAACAATGNPGPVVRGSARFQALSPTLVRMEYSPKAVFVDLASVAVLHRGPMSTVQFGSAEKDGWIELQTGKMMVSYRINSGPFKADNLQVTWQDAAGSHHWKPGDKDTKNLGGVIGDIAIRSTPVTDPGALSRSGYFLLDDSHTALWDPSAEWAKPRPEKDSQDWYFFVYGNDYPHMLEELAKLLGPIPMVPRYVLGAWFGSRAGYSSDEFKMIVERFREESLPLDVLVLDSMSWTSVVWAGYDFDREQMPDPKEFFQWTREHGVRVTLNEHYGALTRQNDRHFDAIRQAMGLPADRPSIDHDLANKQYAELFMDLLHKPALDLGMAFWWQDGCAGANLDGLDPMMWTRRIEYEGSERITGKRAFVFCRLGAWGSHRYGGFFSSDLIPQWNTLTLLVPFTQQAGNMLVAYTINLCAAVYGVNINPELYQRWVQFSSFSPVFWFHGLWGLRLPWEYGAEGIETYRKFVGLRYRLLPYTYTYTRVAHETGLPLVRGMYLEYPNQEPVYAHRQQYMFGKELLVAPITEPGYGKPVLKDMYLPAGHDWFDYFTGRIYGGGQTIAYECPLERMPLLVRAGSILPLAPEMDHTGQKPADPLTLEVYAGNAGAFRLYEDDGESLDYRKGGYAWTPITYVAADAGALHTVTIGPCEGEYAGQAKSRRYTVHLHGLLKPASVTCDGRKLPENPLDEWNQGWQWDRKAGVTTIRLTEPIPVKQKITLAIEHAGAFADARALQKVLDYRERIRRVKHEEKLKYSIAVNGQEHGKPPRVIQETEKIERRLNEIVASPEGLGSHPPDYRAMTQQILRAFVNQPFDSTRTIADLNPSCQAATAAIANVTFEPTELRKMAAILLGLELPARAIWDAPPFHTVGPYLHVQARLDYDTDAIGPAKVSYELEYPDDGWPGWVQAAPVAAADGYTQFNIQHPHPPKPGSHLFKVKALLTWEGGQATIQRDVEWLSTGLP